MKEEALLCGVVYEAVASLFECPTAKETDSGDSARVCAVVQ